MGGELPKRLDGREDPITWEEYSARLEKIQDTLRAQRDALLRALTKIADDPLFGRHGKLDLQLWARAAIASVSTEVDRG